MKVRAPIIFILLLGSLWASVESSQWLPDYCLNISVLENKQSCFTRVSMENDHVVLEGGRGDLIDSSLVWIYNYFKEFNLNLNKSFPIKNSISCEVEALSEGAIRVASAKSGEECWGILIQKHEVIERLINKLAIIEVRIAGDPSTFSSLRLKTRISSEQEIYFRNEHGWYWFRAYQYAQPGAGDLIYGDGKFLVENEGGSSTSKNRISSNNLFNNLKVGSRVRYIYQKEDYSESIVRRSIDNDQLTLSLLVYFRQIGEWDGLLISLHGLETGKSVDIKSIVVRNGKFPIRAVILNGQEFERFLATENKGNRNG